MLHPSRLKWIIMVVGNALFALGSAVASLWLYLQEGPTVLMLTFSALGLIFVVIAVNGTLSLATGRMWTSLDLEGFETRDVWGSRKRWIWSDADGFAIQDINHWPSVIFDDANPAKGWWEAINRAYVGGQASLPDTYGLGAKNLANLMIAWRQRALARRIDSN
jgi:hypothetical protein